MFCLAGVWEAKTGKPRDLKFTISRLRGQAAGEGSIQASRCKPSGIAQDSCSGPTPGPWRPWEKGRQREQVQS